MHCLAASLLILLLIILQSSNSFADSLSDRAFEGELDTFSRSRQWRALLHYESNLFGSWESLADASSFFLAANGKTDPKAELLSTIKAFLRPTTDFNDLDAHPQCQFPARFHWLSEVLKDKLSFPLVKCAEFRQWTSLLAPHKAALVFPSAFLSNPSSMFGHTLLRIDPQGSSKSTELLSYAANYSAHADPNDNSLVYALKGLLGGYPGYFSLLPYYEKVKEYNDLEKRDIWEYKLALTQSEVEMIVRHLWELRAVHFDYFYFRENCSYHLLSLIEVARPELELTRGFHFWATPIDTVRAALRESGLVTDVHYRPAIATTLAHRLTHLNEKEREAVTSLLERERQHDSSELSDEEKALVLEVAYDSQLVDFRDGNLTEEESAQLAFSLLNSRSALGARPRSIPPQLIPKRADRGHETSRSQVGFGTRDEQIFSEVSLRPAYHDLLDDPGGYADGAQIELFKTTLRYYEGEGVRLREFSFADVRSIAPDNPLISPVFWEVYGGVYERRFSAEKDSSVLSLHGSRGYVAHPFRHLSLFGGLTASTEYSGHFADNVSIGVGPKLGLRFSIPDTISIMATAQGKFHFLGDDIAEYDIKLAADAPLGENISLRAEFGRKSPFKSYFNYASVSLQFYF